jgi:CubicO group peptidase (beta-lactamase class C family)
MRVVRPGFLVIVLSATVPPSVEGQSASTAPWRQYADPADAGYSTVKLEAARRYADSVRSGAVMAVVRGSVLVAWGDVSRPLELHSVRKSVVSALYGIATADRKVDTNRTLADLGIDDRQPLTPQEKRARISDLLAARSGIYLPAAYAAADQDQSRPARGSHPPGTHFFYNNWDFNILGVIYERLTGADFYDAFRDRLAGPLGMEDYRDGDGYRVYEPSGSVHPAHTVRLSARDLARFGQLYLQQGSWNGRQLVPAEWITASTRTRSELGEGRGYAWLWWTYAPGSLGSRYPALNRVQAFAGTGTGGQFVLVIPDADLVLVHRGDTDNGRNVSGRDVWTIAEMIASARDGLPEGSPVLVPLQPVTLASQAAAVPRPIYVAIDSTLMAEYAGEYTIAPGVDARVFVFERRLFANFPGQGEAELLGLSRSEFTIKPVPGVRVRFDRDASGEVTGMSGNIGPQQFRGTRN